MAQKGLLNNTSYECFHLIFLIVKNNIQIKLLYKFTIVAFFFLSKYKYNAYTIEI